MSDELDEKIGVMLGRVYKRVDWKRTARGRSPLDVFQHRLKVASTMPSIRRLLEKLCHGLGLQGVDVPVNVLDYLEEHREEVLDRLRNESVYYTLLAREKAREVEA